MYGPVVGVDRLSLTVGSGEVFGFLGPNGAGRTTTLRCLTGLLRPSEGRVRVLGLDPDADHRRLAPHVGYLPGELRLYPELSGAETLDLLAALQGAPVPRRGELCDRLGLPPCGPGSLGHGPAVRVARGGGRRRPYSRTSRTSETGRRGVSGPAGP
ncbi:ATP-binding cassette domain-containing protein [Streptomyces virginiae]|uniref:ATP-binding cassette domain-containing protein n=1 Tax=Streptomyces virginiae TaxID=1961 RepID=UPI0036BCE1DF